MNLLLPTLLRSPPLRQPLILPCSLALSRLPPSFPSFTFFFIPSIHVIRIESFNKKFCSPAESAPFCEFKWKSGRESGRGWRPGGRRALLACKLKCCHLNANKTPPRAESSVEKEGGGQKRGRKRDREREGGRATESSEGENGRKAGLDRSRDRGAYAVEEEISKRISLPSLSHVKLHPYIWRRPNLASLASYPYTPNFSRFSRGHQYYFIYLSRNF